jgi:DNA-binding CsgD family transcriptional regulator
MLAAAGQAREAADVVLSTPSALVHAGSTGAAGMAGPARPGGPGVLLFVSGTAGLAAVTRPLPGAVGVLPEDAGAARISAAIRALAEGLSVGARQLLCLLDDRQGAAGAAAPGDEHLTLREAEVLRGLAAGRANKQIAAELGISQNTVKFYTSSIYGKLRATNRAEAVAMGVRRGLLNL